MKALKIFSQVVIQKCAPYKVSSNTILHFHISLGSKNVQNYMSLSYPNWKLFLFLFIF